MKISWKWYVLESLGFQVGDRWIHPNKQKICNQSINGKGRGIFEKSVCF